MKRTLTALLALVLMVAMFAACSGNNGGSETSSAADNNEVTDNSEAAGDADEGTSSEGGRTIAFVTSTLNNPFMVTIGDTLQQLADEQGDTLIVMDPQYDQAKQVSQIEDAITQEVDAIFMIHVSADGVRAPLEKAHAAGIPVFGIDDPLVDTDLIIANISSNNYNAGKICGEAMLEDYPDGAKIAIIDSPTMVGPVERVNGFMDAIGDREGYEIVAQQDGMASLEVSMPIAENMIQANPDIDVFFCINDPSSIGAISALKANNKLEGVKIYSVDGSPDAKAYLVTGELAVTAAQSPINLAKTTYETFNNYYAGNDVDLDIKVDTLRIDASNVEQYTVDQWQ